MQVDRLLSATKTSPAETRSNIPYSSLIYLEPHRLLVGAGTNQGAVAASSKIGGVE